MLGLDPATCSPSLTVKTVTIDLPSQTLLPGQRYQVTIQCSSAGNCLQALAEAQGAPQFELNFQTDTLWSAVCSSVEDCLSADSGQGIQATFLVKSEGPYRLSLTTGPGALWQVSEIKVSPQPGDQNTLRGFAYSPYRDCQIPDGLQPTEDEISQDLDSLQHSANAIRTYLSSFPGDYAAQRARELGLSVAQGVALGKNSDKNEGEIQAAVQLSTQVQPLFLIAGNEVILRNEITPADLAKIIQRLKQETGLPVAFADVTTSIAHWNSEGRLERTAEMEPIYQAADILLVHIYPFWDGVAAEQAAWYTINVYQQLKALFPSKRVIIGETGWPSRGTPHGKAVPSPNNQRQYFFEFTALADQEGVDYFYFSPFDEPWKAKEAGEIGQSWGISTTDRANKFETMSLVYPRPAPPKPTNTASAIPMATGTVEALVTELPSAASAAVPAFPLFEEFPPIGALGTNQIMGDLESLSFTTCYKDQPAQGRYSMQVDYQPSPEPVADEKGWAGIAWRALVPQPGAPWSHRKISLTRF